ncbi:MAG: AAA family ATPase [Mycoplasmataceae bacterium]|nr:AAA family ATPase [Mycoplasmataceae bacterium]
MTKRFVGLTKPEREYYADLLLALTFKYSSECEDNQVDNFSGEVDDEALLSEAYSDLLGTINNINDRKKQIQKPSPAFVEALKKSPKDIKKYLDHYLVGQEEAKRILSVTFFNHARRINAFNVSENDGKTIQINKSNAIILGPTGTGKTYLIDLLAKFYDIACHSADASTITQAGFQGKSAHDVIEQLFMKSGQDIKKTENGVIFLDEIDKLATTKEGKQNSMAEGAQQSLLKMIEGTEVEIETANKTRVVIDTKNILFVMAGAFVGLIGDEAETKTIGFNKQYVDDIKNKKIMPVDLVDYGMIPELVGRISMIAQMHKLKQKHLVKILKNTKNNVIDQYIQLFSFDNISIDFDEDVYEEIAAKALELKTGARSLKSIVDYLMVEKVYDIDLEHTAAIEIDKEYVTKKLGDYNKLNEN